MKTKLIPALLAAATLTSAIAQSGPAGVPKANANSSTTGSSSSSSANGRTRGQNAYGAASSSAVRYGTRLNSIVRRANPTAPGSIILTSPLDPEKYNELTQDLNVLTLIINRNLDRVFGEKSTEYRLGVPITMAANRSIETSYIQDFGVLVRIHVAFPVATAGEREKKPEPAAAPDTEWEKARRALYAGDADTIGSPTGLPDPAADAPTFDQKLVDELKKEVLDALKNVANVRTMPANESATVVIVGAAEPQPAAIDPLTGLPSSANANRPTVLTIRVQKADSGDDLAKNAKFATYFDTPVTPPPGGGYGGGGLFGTGYSYQTVPDGRR